ncbi:MAG: SCO family protein [Gemmatimonadota bacterium]|nr:SCO family protein [Gemmatimonadota bacterium]
MTRLRPWQIALAAVLLVVAAAPAAFVAFRPVTVIPRLSVAPGLALTDEDGRRLTSDDLKGHMTLYGFAHGTCADGCRGVVSAMAAVQEGLAELPGAPPVRLVTVSFDPANDAPATLQAAARAAGARPGTWSFAVPTDTTAARRLVGEAFGVWYERQADGAFRYDPVLVLVDGLGIRRVEYRLGAPDPQRILGHMRELAVEARAGGAMRFAYEAAHFLSCYSN